MKNNDINYPMVVQVATDYVELFLPWFQIEAARAVGKDCTEFLHYLKCGEILTLIGEDICSYRNLKKYVKTYMCICSDGTLGAVYLDDLEPL